jgi:hypothetical protein
VSLQGDFFRPIVLEVLDWKKNGQHKLLGQAKTSPDEILRKGSGYRVKIEGTSVPRPFHHVMFRRLSRITQEESARHQFMNEALAGDSPTCAPVLLSVCLGAKGFPGQLHFEVAQLISHPSFLDYIRGGCEINFMVAIDFTASK